MRWTTKILIAIALAGSVAWTLPAGPYAVEVVRAQGPFGPAPYDNPAALLGQPAARFFDPFGALSGGITNPRVKLVEAAFNIAADTNGLPTPNLLLTLSEGSEVIVRLDEPATNDPANPYGVDLLVFGNAFYAANGTVNDNVNLNTLPLTGGPFSEPLKVSVSPGYTGLPGELPAEPDSWPWYRYDAGPYADTAFPTHAFGWNRPNATWTTELMDFTKPVNPAFQSMIAAGGLTAADAVDLYAGSGGGTGFDLTPSGFESIRYVKVAGAGGFSGGEVDALTVVRPRLVGDALTLHPDNVASNLATLQFKWLDFPDITQLKLEFTAIDHAALVSTAPVTNHASWPALPGPPFSGVQVTIDPLPASGTVSALANMTLSVGSSYTGHGTDLRVLQFNGADWIDLPFAFDAATSQIKLTGITTFTTFVVTQQTTSSLSLRVLGGEVVVALDPVPGRIHTIERSTNCLTWTAIHTFTATNNTGVDVPDPDPPPGGAFYRLEVRAP